VTESRELERQRDALRRQWHSFLDSTAEIRPQLFAYCRKLTFNLWEAEDLVQDTLLRAFSVLAQVDEPIENPRGYILRIATNLWLDRVRRSRLVQWAEVDPDLIQDESETAERLVEMVAASKRLLGSASPRQVSAVLLKDVFGATLEEISIALQSTQGAIKGLLSRGRLKLENAADLPPNDGGPSAALVDRFVELYNDADQEGLLELILDNAVAGNVGTDTEWGYGPHRSRTSWVNGSLGGHPEWPKEFIYDSQRAQSVNYLGEHLVLVFRTRNDKEALESVIRLGEEDGRIRELRAYSFCPELKREIARHFDVPVRGTSYRYPTPSDGKRYMDQTAD